MRTRLTILLALALSVTAALALAPTAAADRQTEPCLMGPPPIGVGDETFACTYNARTPFSAVLEGGCVPEPIAVTGEAFILEHITERSLDYTASNHAHVRADGVGLLTGDHYTFRSVFNQTIVDRNPGAITYTVVSLGTWTRPGGHNDAYARFVAHFTYTYANGVANSFVKVDADCR